MARSGQEANLPLIPEKPREKTQMHRAISQTFQSTAHLANLLPTGTVLSFQLLSPLFTNQGNCDPVTRSMTLALLLLCGFSCFLSSFTDSIRGKDGDVRYGFATPHGICVIDGTFDVTEEIAEGYKLQVVDFAHALMSLLVFAAIALFDQNVMSCFCPRPSFLTQELLSLLPVGLGVVCSMFFVAFPSRRHGIGFPLSAN